MSDHPLIAALRAREHATEEHEDAALLGEAFRAMPAADLIAEAREARALAQPLRKQEGGK